MRATRFWFLIINTDDGWAVWPRRNMDDMIIVINVDMDRIAACMCGCGCARRTVHRA